MIVTTAFSARQLSRPGTWELASVQQAARSKISLVALAEPDPGWLADLITRQVPLDQWSDAYTRGPDDIKTILNFPGA